MIVYNITTKVSWTIADAWLKWQQQEYLPEIMATKLFDSYKMFRLLEHDDDDGAIYITQFFISTEKKYKQYINEFSSLFQQKSFEKWGDQFIAHKTIMQVVN